MKQSWRSGRRRTGRLAGLGAAACTALGLAGCAQLAPGSWAPGKPIAEARGALVGPTGEYPLPGGGTRLEYAAGAFGRQTFMLDFDAAGRLVTSRQVLGEPEFAAIAPGMTAGEVRFRLGRPAQVFGIGWQRREVWNYRWFGGDCVWWQISIDDATRRVVDSGQGQDPACDVKGRD